MVILFWSLITCCWLKWIIHPEMDILSHFPTLVSLANPHDFFSATHEKWNWIAKASFKPVMITLSLIKDTKASYKFHKSNIVHYILGLFFFSLRETDQHFCYLLRIIISGAILHTKLWLQNNFEFWWNVRDENILNCGPEGIIKLTKIINKCKRQEMCTTIRMAAFQFSGTFFPVFVHLYPDSKILRAKMLQNLCWEIYCPTKQC